MIWSNWTTPRNPARWLVDWVRGWDTDESQDRRLSSEGTLSYAPIWYGVNKIAGHIAQLPVGVYRRLERGAERDRKHNVHRVMRRPNPYQSSVLFREQVATHSLLEGNGRAAIVRRSSGANSGVSELIPLMPECTATFLVNGEKWHGTRPDENDRLRLFFKPLDATDERPDGSPNGIILLPDRDVVHIPGLSCDGVNGLPLRRIAQRNLGASINTEKRLGAQMEKGFAGNLMLEIPTGLLRDKKEAEEFLENFERKHNSPEKAGKVGMLREGMKANLLTMNNRDAEMIENRKFQRQDAALWLGLESILGDDSSVSYNSLEQKNLAYLMNTLNKWLSRWEQELEFKLLPKRQFDSESHFIRFNTAALLKSDYKTAVESLAQAIGATIMSPNEAREKLDMNPYEGGDKYQNPAINVNESDTDSDDADTEEDTDTRTNTTTSGIIAKATKAELAIQSHVRHLIGVEANRVKRAAETAKNFLAYVDNFYSQKWESHLADSLEEMGIDRDEASRHCEESKRRLLEVCDFSTPENLVENVAKCVSDWKSRATQIEGVASDV